MRHLPTAQQWCLSAWKARTLQATIVARLPVGRYIAGGMTLIDLMREGSSNLSD